MPLDAVDKLKKSDVIVIPCNPICLEKTLSSHHHHHPLTHCWWDVITNSDSTSPNTEIVLENFPTLYRVIKPRFYELRIKSLRRSAPPLAVFGPWRDFETKDWVSSAGLCCYAAWRKRYTSVDAAVLSFWDIITRNNNAKRRLVSKPESSIIYIGGICARKTCFSRLVCVSVAAFPCTHACGNFISGIWIWVIKH